MKVADLYLKDSLKTDNTEEIKTAQPKDENVFSVNPDTLKAYVGDYELQPGFVISITEDNGELFAQATGQTKIKLDAISSTAFTTKVVEAKISFHRDNNNNVHLLKLEQGGGIFDALRLKPFDKSSVNLAEFTGRFYSDELATEYNFILKNDTLVATHARLSDIKMTPVKSNFFVGNQWFFGQTEFVRDNNNAVVGCKVSGGRVRNLWFKKVS